MLAELKTAFAPRRLALFCATLCVSAAGGWLFARIGIPAHSLSSYNLVTPYHSPKDEASIVNVEHMAQGALPRPRLGVVLPDVPLAKAVVR